MAPFMSFVFPRGTTDGELPPDENVGPILMGITGVLTAMIVSTTSVRIYVRARQHMLGWDDWTILITTLMAVTRMAVQAVQCAHGNGRHQEYLAKEDVQFSNMMGWYAQLLLFASVCLLKVSILLLILRIKDSRRLRIFLYIVMGGLAITNFGCILILLAECSPVSAYWTGQTDKCWPTKVRIYAIYFTISYSVLTDLLCSILPIVVVWNVRIPFKTKLAVGGLMSMGLVATGFGVARAASLGISSRDLTYVYAIVAIWSNLELFLGITAANLALSRSAYKYFRYGNNPDSTQASSSYGASKKSGYINSSSLRPDPFEPPSTLVVSNRRRASDSKSESSDIPLEPGIQKKTEFWVSEEEGSTQSRSSRNPSKR